MGFTVRWRAFPLHPDTPEEGLTLKALFSGRSVDIPQMLQRLAQTAAAENLPFGTRTHTYNSRKAQEMGKWAEANQVGEPFHRAVFQAYFARGVNIARTEALCEIAQSVGLRASAAKSILADGVYHPAVDRDWEASRQLGITAVPTFLFAGRRLVGAASEHEIQALMKSAG